MITGTRESDGIRSNRMRKLPRDQWTVIDGAHDAIVPEATFQAARQAMQSRIRTVNQNTARSRKDNLYVCGFCGRKLQKSGSKELSLVCPKARNVSGTPCAAIHENLAKLQENTLSVVRSMASTMLEKSEKHKLSAGSTESQLRREIDSLSAQTDRLQNGKLTQYEDYRGGRLTRERFVEIQNSNQLRLDGLRKEIEAKQDQLDQMETESRQMDQVARQAEEIWLLAEYRPEVISRLVERVRVFDGGRLELELKCWDFTAE